MNLKFSPATLMFSSRLAALFGGALLTFVIPLGLSRQEQGYFFLFNSVIAFQMFFEMGMGQVIVQAIASEMDSDYSRTYKPEEKKFHINENITSIIKFLNKWFLCSSFMFFCTVSVFGILYFGYQNLITKGYLNVWILYTFVTSINMYLSHKLMVLEGFNEISLASRIRTSASFFGYLCAIILILTGFHLWSLLCVPFFNCIAILFGITIANAKFYFVSMTSQNAQSEFSWREQFLPFQIRISVSWMAGYFSGIGSLPVLFKFVDTTVVGAYGLTLAILNAIVQLSISLMQSSLPQITNAVASKSSCALKIFHNRVKKVFMIYLAMILFICSVMLIIDFVNIDFRSRLLDSFDMAIVFVNGFFICLNFCFAAFVRSFRSEPFYAVSLLGALINLVSIVFLTPYSFTFYLMAVLLSNSLIGFPVIYYYYKLKVKELGLEL